MFLITMRMDNIRLDPLQVMSHGQNESSNAEVRLVKDRYWNSSEGQLLG